MRQVHFAHDEDEQGQPPDAVGVGLADGYKGQDDTAILPGIDQVTERSWTEQEYLSIYNRIVYGGISGSADDVFMVWNQETNKATQLARWLSR